MTEGPQGSNGNPRDARTLDPKVWRRVAAPATYGGLVGNMGT